MRLMRLLCRAKLRCDIGVANKRDRLALLRIIRSSPFAALNLDGTVLSRAPIAHRRAKDADISIFVMRLAGFKHLERARNTDNIDTRRVTQGNRACNQRDLGLAARRSLGDGKTRFTAAAVGDKSNGIEVLTRRASRDQNLKSRHVVEQGKLGQRCCNYGLRLFHATRAISPAGKMPASWVDDMHTTLL